MVTRRYNFSTFMAQNRFKAGSLMKEQNKTAASLSEYKRRFLKLLIYLCHSERELEIDRRELMRNHDLAVSSLISYLFGKNEKIAIMIFKNKLELGLGSEFELVNLKIALMRVQDDVDFSH